MYRTLKLKNRSYRDCSYWPVINSNGISAYYHRQQSSLKSYKNTRLVLEIANIVSRNRQMRRACQIYFETRDGFNLCSSFEFHTFNRDFTTFPSNICKETSLQDQILNVEFFLKFIIVLTWWMWLQKGERG